MTWNLQELVNECALPANRQPHHPARARPPDVLVAPICASLVHDTRHSLLHPCKCGAPPPQAQDFASRSPRTRRQGLGDGLLFPLPPPKSERTWRRLRNSPGKAPPQHLVVWLRRRRRRAPAPSKPIFMRPRCPKHHVPLRPVTLPGGKTTWLCQHSHFRHQEPPVRPICSRCHQRQVYSEGLWYPCWYYR